MKKTYLYSARDISTGKLVSDITSPGKRYWQRKEAAEELVKERQTCRKRVEELNKKIDRLVAIKNTL